MQWYYNYLTTVTHPETDIRASFDRSIDVENQVVSIQVGERTFGFNASEVLRTLSPMVYHLHFTEWLRANAWTRVEEELIGGKS